MLKEIKKWGKSLLLLLLVGVAIAGLVYPSLAAGHVHSQGRVSPTIPATVPVPTPPIQYVSSSGGNAPAASPLPATSPVVELLMDNSIYNVMGINTAANYFNNAADAFANKWSIYLQPTYVVFTSGAGLPFNDTSCAGGSYASHCVPTNVGCGIPDYCSFLHHKSLNYNLDYLLDVFPSDLTQNGGAYDLIYLLSNTAVCTHMPNPYGGQGGYHDQNNTGLTYPHARDYAVSTLRNSTQYLDIYATRVIQHELSHLYGCEDGECSPNQKCIMSTKFLTDDDYTKDVWCDNCEAMFDPSAH